MQIELARRKEAREERTRNKGITDRQWRDLQNHMYREHKAKKIHAREEKYLK